MMLIENNKRTIQRDETKPLCLAMFCMAFLQGIWWIAIPFIINRLHGSDAQVGNCCALQLGGYIVGCLIARLCLDKLNARMTTLSSLVLLLMATIATLLLLYSTPDPVSSAQGIRFLLCLSGLSGLIQAFFWPFVMAWISTGYEGSQLNRKLGWLNVSWTSGRLISPLIGGILVQYSSTTPISAMILCIVAAFLCVCLAPPPRQQDPLPQPPGSPPPSNDLTTSLAVTFRWMALLALVSSSICIALIRSQMGLLFKYELGFSESDFGLVNTFLALATFVVMLLTGKTSAWHYRLGFFVAAHILILLTFIAILAASRLPVFYLLIVVFGGSFGFLFASHLYYVVAGSRNRSACMLLHELGGSTGMFIGSLAGGYLSDSFGRYMPYWFGIAIITVTSMAQWLIWLAHKAKNNEKASIPPLKS